MVKKYLFHWLEELEISDLKKKPTIGLLDSRETHTSDLQTRPIFDSCASADDLGNLIDLLIFANISESAQVERTAARQYSERNLG